MMRMTIVYHLSSFIFFIIIFISFVISFHYRCHFIGVTPFSFIFISFSFLFIISFASIIIYADACLFSPFYVQMRRHDAPLFDARHYFNILPLRLPLTLRHSVSLLPFC